MTIIPSHLWHVRVSGLLINSQLTVLNFVSWLLYALLGLIEEAKRIKGSQITFHLHESWF
uniref:Uncharacterized protein n=1 Tax=Helianthus annuus TaxID=4232 RepID=A0A251STK7_HELAN